MVALAMATPLFTSCYDDSALNEKLEDIQTEVDKLKSDLAALQAAVDNNLSVVDYKQIEGGYELTMSDGSTITILNGKDGAAGAAGQNGANGTNGKDGKDGEKGEKGDKGDKGDAFFESVELSDDGLYLVITLVSGTVYELPMGGFNLVFEAPETLVEEGVAVKVPYTIVGAAETDEVFVRILASSNCTAEVLAAEKAVSLTPALGAGYVDVYAINNTTGELKARTIAFNGYSFSVEATEFAASPIGGSVEVPVSTSVDYEIEIDGAWLKYVDVEIKAVRNETLVFSAEAENTTGAVRKATVTLKEKETGKLLASFSVSQKPFFKELLGEYIESYSQYGMPTTGKLKIERSDDPSKGTYKVTICGTTLYADYEEGKLNCYDGKYTRTLTVAEDFSRFEVKDLSIGYSTYSDYVAFPALGAPELTEAELALVGTYNESWTHSKHAPATNAMVISASEEASFGRLYVKFLVTEDGSAYAGYATLEESVLTVQIGGQSHPKLGTQWNPDVKLALTVNADGTLTMPTWKDANYNDLSDYVATKVVEGEGGDEGATLESLVGTWHEKFSAGSPYENDLMTIELSDDPSKGQLKVNMFVYSTYKLACYANLSEDGTTLTVLSNGVDFSGMGTFSENMIMTVSEGGKKIEFNKTINTSYQMPIGMLEATKIEETAAAVKPADLVGTWHETFSAGSTYENDLMSIELSDDPSKGQLKVKMFVYESYGTYELVAYANLSEDGTTLTVLTNGVAYSSMGTFSEDMVMTVSEGGKKIEFNKTINTSYQMPIGMLVATKN